MSPMEQKLDDVGVANWGRVDVAATRTTPKPCLDVLEVIPSLAAKARTAVRLHPRYCPDLPMDVSKLGGVFLWPATAAWPVCPEHREPYLAALQLRAEDFPEMPFPEGTDLFQWLWCGGDHGWTENAVFWRKAANVGDRLEHIPLPKEAEERYLPVPCALHPERVTEYPGFYDLTAEQQQTLRTWRLPELPERPWLESMGSDAAVDLYKSELSVCPGTKIGGYADDWQRKLVLPRSADGRPLEYLLTISAVEFGGRNWPRWEPVEDRPFRDARDNAPKFARISQELGWKQQMTAAAQLFGGEGRIHLFVDRQTLGWPAADYPTIP